MQGDNASTGPWEYRSLSDIRDATTGRLDRAAQPSPFDRYDWLESLHRHCLPRQLPRILRAQEGDAEAWLFLIQRTARHASALANWYSFAWSPIFTGAPGEARRHRLLQSVARALSGHQAHLDFYPVRDPGPLAAAFRAAGWRTVLRPFGVNHYLDLNGRGFDQYWAARPGPLRTLVKRKGRGDPFALTIHTAFTEALWQDYVAIYRRSWKADADTYPFLRELAERESAAGTLRLGIARRNGQPVAAQLWTIENGAALIHKLAHDQAYDEASPGTLLSHHMFRAAIDGDRVSRIDYGTGDNPYKRDWMEQRRPLYRLDAFNPRFPAAWLPCIRAQYSALVGQRPKR